MPSKREPFKRKIYWVKPYISLFKRRSGYYRHGASKAKNWTFQVEGTFHLRNRRTGKKVKVFGVSEAFSDYRDRDKLRLNQKGREQTPRMDAFNFAVSQTRGRYGGESGDWAVRKVKWATIRWADVSEKTYKAWKKKQEKKRRKK